MIIDNDIKLDFKDVLIRPKRSELASRSEVTLRKTYNFRNGKSWTGIPVMAANMDTTGTFETATVLSQYEMVTVLHKHHSVEAWQTFIEGIPKERLAYVSVCCGTSDADFDKIGEIFSLPGAEDIPFLCVDVANGYALNFAQSVSRIRKAFPDKILISGNVVTNEMTEELLMQGGDIIKVGIGPGSVCTTRKLTGVGYPQLSATIECADAAHGLKGHVCSDGGMTNPGDIAKAFGAGADFVMLGGMFAGHEESGGENVEVDGKKYKAFYGMSSETAMKKYAGGVAKYRAAEGKTVLVPYRGSIHATALDILGGVRSACTYVGAMTLKELPRRTTFIRVTQQLNQTYNGTETHTGPRAH